MSDYQSSKLRAEQLRKELNHHIYRYYVENENDISDYEYDMLMRELKAIEEEYPDLLTADSPTHRVGGSADKAMFQPVEHKVKMESLQDAFSVDEVYDFDRKVKSGNAYTYYLVANGKDGYQSPKSGPHRVYYLSTPYDLKARAAGSRTAVLTWKKVRGASGYQIRYSVKKNMKSAKWVFIKKGSTLKKEIKKLRKKKYYFQIRAYRNVPGYKVYSAWGQKTVRKIR